MFLLLYITKEHIKSNLVLYISIILLTGLLIQISSTDFFENNDNRFLKLSTVYAQDDGGGDDGGDSDDGGDEGSEDESDDSREEESEESDDSEENVDRSYEYEGEDESTETDEEQEFEEQEFKAEEEDNEADEATNIDNIPQGPNIKASPQFEFDKAKEELEEAEQDLEPIKTGPVIVDYDEETKEELEDKEKEKQFEEEKAALEDALCDDENAKTTNIKICKGGNDNKNGRDRDDNDDRKKIIIKKEDNDDDDDDNDIEDVAAYNMGYRNGKFDRINKMPFNDAFPFDDKDGKTWYTIGYRSGWDSGS